MLSSGQTGVGKIVRAIFFNSIFCWETKSRFCSEPSPPLPSSRSIDALSPSSPTMFPRIAWHIGNRGVAWLRVHKLNHKFTKIFIQWMLDFSEGEFDERNIPFYLVYERWMRKANLNEVNVVRSFPLLFMPYRRDAVEWIFYAKSVFYAVAVAVVLVVCYFSGFVQLKCSFSWANGDGAWI